MLLISPSREDHPQRVTTTKASGRSSDGDDGSASALITDAVLTS